MKATQPMFHKLSRILSSLHLRSHRYYWYTGQKRIAIASLLVSSVIMLVCLVVGAGYSVWGIVVSLLLDSVGFWLAMIYFLVLRSHVPGLGLSYVDTWISTQLLWPLILGAFITRVSTLLVARTISTNGVKGNGITGVARAG